MRLPNDIFTSVRKDEITRLVELAQDKNVLEVGSWIGYSSVAMAQVAKVVHAVDWHQGDSQAGHENTLPTMWSNIKRYRLQDKIVIHVGRSENVLPLFKSEMFDLIFIDAYHTVEAVTQDIELSLRLLKPDGIIAFHDYGDERFGVTAAVDAAFPEFAKDGEIVNTLAIVTPLTIPV